jgi:hypothetical protein
VIGRNTKFYALTAYLSLLDNLTKLLQHQNQPKTPIYQAIYQSDQSGRRLRPDLTDKKATPA